MIKTALLSVSDKTGLIEFAKSLAARGVELISTGGTVGGLWTSGLPGGAEGLDPQLTGGLQGLEGFSHILVTFFLDRAQGFDQAKQLMRKPRGRDSAGVWAGYDKARHAGVLNILPASASRPDEVAQALNIETAEEMWEALADAAQARRGTRAGHATAKSLLDERADQAEDFAKRAVCSLQFGATARPVRAGTPVRRAGRRFGRECLGRRWSPS